MNVDHILSKAQSLGVRLSLDGDIVKMRGPANAIAVIKPDIAAHKPEILDYLRAAERETYEVSPDCVGALRDPDGGLYLPWGPYLDTEQLMAIQRTLFEIVDELAKLEHWPDDVYDIIAQTIGRQPISTLKPDLVYFRQRLETAMTKTPMPNRSLP